MAPGILHDQVIDQMTSQEFDSVIRVKLQGTMNLCKAAEKNGLRFFVGLSSIVSVLGNPGQANYCAANRGDVGVYENDARKKPFDRFQGHGSSACKRHRHWRIPKKLDYL